MVEEGEQEKRPSRLSQFLSRSVSAEEIHLLVLLIIDGTEVRVENQGVATGHR